MAQLNEAVIEEVRRQAHIEEVVGSYIPLVKAGRQFKAVCPFHDDHSPSMSINTDKQIYKCFVCGSGGNAFTFVQNYEQVSFPQAVKRVADICHIDVDIDLKEEVIEVSEEKKILYKILNETINYCKYQLNTEKGQEVVNYLHNRGLDDELIAYFDLGYNPEGHVLYQYLSSKGYEDEDIINAGVCRLGSNGIVDVFDDRIMFPIHDGRGNPIAFSARDFSNQNRAKYINTAQCVLYTKSEVLYNAHRVRNLNHKYKELFVVEGPLDAMALYRAGFPNVVATMGTAFTKEQAQMVKRLAPVVNICYDGDEAGQNANYKAGVILKSIGANFKIVKNTTGKDPDEIIRDLGKEELQFILETPYTWVEFLFNYQLKKFKLDNFTEKKEFAKSLMSEIEGASSFGGDAFDKEYYLDRLSSLTGFPVNTLHSLVSGAQIKEPETQVRRTIKNYSRAELTEMQIIAQLLNSSEAAYMFEEQLGYLNIYPMKLLALHICNYYHTHDNTNAEISDLISEIDDLDERKMLFEIDESKLFVKEFDKQLLIDEFNEIRSADLNQRIEELKKELEMINDIDRKGEIYKEIVDLRNKRKG